MRISAFLPVYNEENRIRYTLQSLQWCDEIIVIDKSSADNTVDICKSFGATVFIMNNSNTFDISEYDYLNQCTGDWILLATASDIIDKSLAMEIRKQIDILPLEIGCIEVPFKNYILGIDDERSPWHAITRLKVFRNGNQVINNDVHGALSLKNKKAYIIPDKFGYFSHLTHVSLDMMLDRHTRYWRGEAEMYDKKSLLPALQAVWRSVKYTMRVRKTFLLGWDGIAIMFAYISYYMFSYLYIWEHRRKETAVQIYQEMRDKNTEEWKNYSNNLT